MARKKFNFNVAAAASTEEVKNENEIVTIPEENKSEVEVEELPAEQITSPVTEILNKLDIEDNKNKTAFNFKLIPINKIAFNEKNNYPMENIEKLAESILDFGLLHNLSVTYDIDTDTYVIDSGERRFRAISKLIEEYKDESEETEEFKKYQRNVKPFENGIPCNVKQKDEVSGEIDSEIRLILANEEVREQDPQRKMEQINRLHELYTLKNKNSDSKININKKISEDLGISTRQIINYKNINNLIPELQEEFKNNNITVTEGSNFSKLSEEEQKQIAELLKQGQKVSKEEVKHITQKMNEMEKSLEKANEEKEKEIKEILEKLEEEKKSLAAKKENEIKNLEEKLQQNALDKDRLKKELQAELESEKDTDEKFKKELEEKINILNKEKEKLSAEKVQAEKSDTEKEHEIAALKEELKKLENQKVSQLKEVDTDILKKEFNLENSIKDIKYDISKVMAAYDQYKKHYTEEAKNTLNVNDVKEYENQIKELIRRLESCIK